MTAANSYDAIIIGGGMDALVAAIVLTKARKRVLHLVRDENPLGLQGTIEIKPGFHAPLEVEAQWIPPSVVRAMDVRVAVTPPTPQIPASVVLPDGGFLSLPTSATAATAAIKVHSTKDAERWPGFVATMRELAGFLEVLYQLPPTDLDGASLGELPALLSLGRSFRSLGKANMRELLRVMPMSVQDVMDEQFTFGPLKAAVGAAAVRDIRQGPRSGGTSFVLLHYLTGAVAGAIRGRPELACMGTPWTLAKTVQLQATSRLVTTRTNADIARILVKNDAVTGVLLAGGEEFTAPVVLSTEDPSRTFLQMVDPVWLDPEFMLAVKNIKFRGATATVHFAIDGVPDAPGLADPTKALAGVVSLSGSLDAIEQAYDAVKYGAIPNNPHITFSMPTLRADEFAPGHVGVATVQFVPHALRGAEWTPALSDAIADTVTAALTRVMPKFAEHVLHRSVMTPMDIESRFGLTEGAVTQGEITLDQILFMRPVAGWGQYATPIDGLYVAGAGTHPGPGVLGASGLLAAKRMLRDGKKL